MKPTLDHLDPKHKLLMALLVLRGGECKYELLERDFERWVARRGMPTAASVQTFFDENREELEFFRRLHNSRLEAAN